MESLREAKPLLRRPPPLLILKEWKGEFKRGEARGNWKEEETRKQLGEL